VKIGRMMSLYMVEITVGLVCEYGKLASASLEEFQFWTENAEDHLVDLDDANGADLLDLRVWLEGL
jgi:hypothetical protein